LNNKELNQRINPDETVVSDVTIQAAVLTGNKPEEVKDILPLNVAPTCIVCTVQNNNTHRVVV
jgi:molecular chaperone DnaK (HSP70)